MKIKNYAIFHEQSSLRREMNDSFFFKKYNLYPSPKKVYSRKSYLHVVDDKTEETYYRFLNRKSYKNLDYTIPIKQKDLLKFLYLSYHGESGNNTIVSVPSAGGRYSSSIYVAIFNVLDTESGIYYWNPFNFSLELVISGDFRNDISNNVNIYNKKDILKSSFTIFIASNLQQTCEKYGDRGYRFALIDVGCIVQNFYLLCQDFSFETRSVGGFFDKQLKRMIPNNKDDIILIQVFGVPPRFGFEQLEMSLSNKYFEGR